MELLGTYSCLGALALVGLDCPREENASIACLPVSLPPAFGQIPRLLHLPANAWVQSRAVQSRAWVFPFTAGDAPSSVLALLPHNSGSGNIPGMQRLNTLALTL